MAEVVDETITVKLTRKEYDALWKIIDGARQVRYGVLNPDTSAHQANQAGILRIQDGLNSEGGRGLVSLFF